MRYYRKVPKKPTGRDLLARPIPTVDNTSLRKMADLASRLGFESSEIGASKDHPASIYSTALNENHRPFLVTEGPKEAQKYRYGILRIEDHEENRKYMFIPYLYENRDEQGEGITYFYRLRSVYLKFFDIPDQGSSDDRDIININLEWHRVTEGLRAPVLDTSPPAGISDCDRSPEPNAICIDESTNGEAEKIISA